MSLQYFRSERSFANALMRGLSCKLWPFFPRRPHLDVNAPLSSMISILLELRFLSWFVVFVSDCEDDGRVVFPRIEDIDECAQRACFRMADVTVIHSVTTRATGSIATATVFGICIGESMVIECPHQCRRGVFVLISSTFTSFGYCAYADVVLSVCIS
jgi:hypothetical protein